MSHQQFLPKKPPSELGKLEKDSVNGRHLGDGMDKTDAALVNGNQQLFGEVGFGRLFHLEEGRAKRRPAIYDLQEVDLGIFGTHSCFGFTIPVSSVKTVTPTIRCHFLNANRLPES